MVRATKTSTDKQTVAPVVSAAAETKAPRVKKTKAAVEVAPVESVAAPVVADASAVVAEVSDASSLAVKLTEFGAKLQQLASIFSTAKNDFKTLEKIVNREMKNAQKSSAKKRKASGNRAPSGFVKPTRISDELANFLGKTIGTEMARTAVSKEINGYIRANDLQDKANGRKINPDAKLVKLLKLNKDEELTYFNLQKYMKHHFVKAVPAEVAQTV
jgi:chromatin remodeling complex protein RSC6